MQIKLRSCFKCKYEAETAADRCPRCGRARFYSSTNIRVRGGLLVILGSFLVAFMGTISIWTYGVIFPPESAGGTRFTGSANELALIAGVFGFVILFGFIAVVTGLWQLILGRRNMILVWAIIGLGIIFIVGGQAIYFFN